MAKFGMAIGLVAKKSGCTPATIRFYEDKGLLAPVGRGANGRRVYGWPDVSRLTFIRRLRSLGFSMQETRALIEALQSPKASCLSVRDLALAHLETVRARRADLDALEQTLTQLTSSCTDACMDGPTQECTIMKDFVVETA